MVVVTGIEPVLDAYQATIQTTILHDYCSLVHATEIESALARLKVWCPIPNLDDACVESSRLHAGDPNNGSAFVSSRRLVIHGAP